MAIVPMGMDIHEQTAIIAANMAVSTISFVVKLIFLPFVVLSTIEYNSLRDMKARIVCDEFCVFRFL